MTKDLTITSAEFIPTQNFILVEQDILDRGEVQTETGLVLATSQNQSVVDKSTSGTVLAVGPKVEGIEVGCRVYWPRTDGLDLEFSDGEFMLFKDTSIVGYRDAI